MNILDLLQQNGHPLRRVSSTHGGEYAGPCPFCGGNDRFRVWPEQDRYWCRQCGKTGDPIQYLKDAKGMTYMQACSALQIDQRVIKPLARQKRRTWTPREPKRPQEAWQEKASSFLIWAQKQLWSDRGAKEGKDPTEAMQRGLNIRLWVSAGLYFCEGISLSCSTSNSRVANSHESGLDIIKSWRSDDPKVVFIDQTKSIKSEV